MLRLKQKQQEVINAVNNPNIHTIVLIGTVGTGKTDIAAHVGISLCYTFPKTYWPVFRQNSTTASRTTVPSYLNMLDMMNLVPDEDYIYTKKPDTIRFPHNKSEIVFVEADITKDRQGRKLKGINATANHIDEADELAQIMFVTATSRRGRRNQNGQPSISIITMNPNDTYLKDLYYKPYRAGNLPPGVAVIEFTLEDSWQTKMDIEAMKTNPRGWVERYLNNNWDYEDDDTSMFKYRYFDAAITDELDGNALRYAGYDVARSGTDRSVMALWYGRTLVDILIFKDKNEQITTDIQSEKVIKFMNENAILQKNMSVDAVGIGVGVIDNAKSKGIHFLQFISGSTPPSKAYKDLRSQVIWEFSQGLEKGNIKIYRGCSFRNELISEALAHLYEVNDKKLAVESKDQVKKRTGGLSPDIFDAVVMGLYPQLNLDPKQDSSRVVF